jgi:hypothetical protein
VLGADAAPAIPALVRYLGGLPDRHNYLSDSAEHALKSIGQVTVPQVLAVLDDPSRRTRAIHILEYLNVHDMSLFDGLLKTWEESKEKDPILLRYLVKIAPEKAVGPLREAWEESKEKDPILLRYLVKIAPEKAVGPLREALESNQLVRIRGETVYGKFVYLDASAARIIAGLEAVEPAVALELSEAMHAAVGRIVEGLEKEIPEALAKWHAADGMVDLDLSDAILRLAYYGKYARPAAARIRALGMNSSHPRIGIWLADTLACIDEDPRPHIKHLCGIMRAADSGHGVGLAGVFGYMGAWAAGSPAGTAQESLDKIARIAGVEIAPVLKELRREYPRRIDECLKAIEQQKRM